MDRRSITIALPEELVKRAAAFVAEHNTTIEAMVENPGTVSREELHERRQGVL